MKLSFLLGPLLITGASALNYPQSRVRQLEKTTLSNGAELAVDITSPTTGSSFDVDSDSCDVNVDLAGTAGVGQGDPDVSYIFVIDESGSTASILGQIKSFFKGLTDVVFDEGSAKNVGVVTFNDAATIETPLTNVITTIKDAIDEASSSGFTNCRDGLVKAKDLATSSAAGGTIIVIFAGDGICNRPTSDPDPTNDANALGILGVIVDVVAIGGVGCNDEDLGSIPQDPGTCTEVAEIGDYEITTIIGTKLTDVEYKLDTSAYVSLAGALILPADGPTSKDFAATLLDVGLLEHTVCAKASGRAELDDDAVLDTEVEECVTFTVVDSTPPVITCPTAITANNDPGECSAVVVYAVTATDNCPDVGMPTQTAGLPSGSAFPVGTTSNTWSVSDDAGNSVTCSFDVTVNDVEPPTAECVPGVNPSGNEPTADNQDGFYTIRGEDNCSGPDDITPQVWDSGLDGVADTEEDYAFVVEGGFSIEDVFKYVEAPGAPNKEKKGSGDVDWKLTGNGDAYLVLTDEYGNASVPDNEDAFCRVAPPPVRRLRGVEE